MSELFNQFVEYVTITNPVYSFILAVGALLCFTEPLKTILLFIIMRIFYTLVVIVGGFSLFGILVNAYNPFLSNEELNWFSGTFVACVLCVIIYFRYIWVNITTD